MNILAEKMKKKMIRGCFKMINGQLLKLAPIEVMVNLPYFFILILHVCAYVRSSIISCQDDKLTIHESGRPKQSHDVTVLKDIGIILILILMNKVSLKPNRSQMQNNDTLVVFTSLSEIQEIIYIYVIIRKGIKRSKVSLNEFLLREIFNDTLLENIKKHTILEAK